MRVNNVPVPHLTTAHRGPLHQLERIILNQISSIEFWFREKWRQTPPPLTSSVDLRHAGFKLAPVDTNLFPAGFNNLNQDFLPLCVQAVQSVMADYEPACRTVLLLPESHTRNRFYLKSLAVLKDIFSKAGFQVRIGSLDPSIIAVTSVLIDDICLQIEPLIRKEDRLSVANFDPCMILLNNDLSSGVPEILQGLQQPIRPTAKLGWASRLKSQHFHYFEEVAAEFAELINLDPWLINPYFKGVAGIDFMAQEGLDRLAEETALLLAHIKAKYTSYGIADQPFVVIKADSGTYGMSVMMVHTAEEVRQLNRKQRTRMAVSKGNRKVDRVMLQEGVYTFETMPNGAVAEPVVYMIGQFVVGGFYRVHQGRNKDENLNAPGMHFEPLAFAQACNMPNGGDSHLSDCPNRFYVYGVIARLAALAGAREIAVSGDKL